MTSTGKTLWHTGVYAAGLVANRGIAYLLVPVYSRVWAEEPSAFSIWDVSTATVLMLAPIVEVAMATGLQRFYFQYADSPDQRKVFNVVLQFVLGACAFFLLAAWLFAGSAAEFLFDSADERKLVLIVGGIVCGTVLSNVPLSMMRAQQRSFGYSVLSLLRGVVAPPISLYLLLRHDMGPAGVLWGELAGHLAVFAVGMIVYRSWIRPETSLTILRSLLLFSLPIVVARFGIITVNYSDRYLLKHLIGLEDMAPASLAFKAAIAITLFTRAVQMGWPASAFELDRQEGGRAQMATAIRALAVVFAGAAVGLAAIAPELVALLGPEEYAAARWYVPWIGLAYAIFGGMLLITTVITVSKKTYLFPLLYLSGGAMKLVLGYFMIQAWGAMGAPLSTVAVYLMMLAFGYYLAQRVYPVEHELGKLIALLVCTGLGVLALTSAEWMLPDYSLVARLALLAVFGVSVIGFGIVSMDELRGIVTMLRSRRRKPNGGDSAEA
jgi:O-antigen/teichoic acid export membrane protein